MEQKNYSKQIRRYVINQCDLINDVFNGVSNLEMSQLLFESLDNIESDKKVHILNGYKIPEVFDFSILKGISVLSRIQMYTDYYKSAKLQDKLYNTSELAIFPKIKSYEDIKNFSKNDIVQYEMVESLKEYNDSTGFDKVLFAKCLDKKDIKHLKSINPFFEYEYNKSNIEVDLDFIIKHIEKWQKYYPFDTNLSYDKASAFIFDLYHIRKEEAENLLLDLFREDLGIISSTNPDEECIKMGQINLTMPNLATMFKDYYKYQKKVLKKR